MRSIHSFFRVSGFVLLLCPALLLADFHFDANKQDEVDAEARQLADELTAFLAEYEEAYDNQNYRKVKSMWVLDGNPIYMAEEVPFPLYGDDRMASYFNPVPGKRILDGIDNTYTDVRAKYLTPDIAVATYKLVYDIKLMGRPATGGWNRIMAVFQKVDGDWKLTAYTEAPQGPATMVRKMMKAHPAGTEQQKEHYAITTATINTLLEQSTREGFDEFVAARKDQQPLH